MDDSICQIREHSFVESTKYSIYLMFISIPGSKVMMTRPMCYHICVGIYHTGVC